MVSASPVRRVLRAGSGNLDLKTVANRQQLGFVHHVFAAVFEMVLVHMRFHDRIDRAAFFAEAAENALEQIDVVARGAALTITGARRESMVIAKAGQTASHNLQAMQRSSPLA